MLRDDERKKLTRITNGNNSTGHGRSITASFRGVVVSKHTRYYVKVAASYRSSLSPPFPLLVVSVFLDFTFLLRFESSRGGRSTWEIIHSRPFSGDRALALVVTFNRLSNLRLHRRKHRCNASNVLFDRRGPLT